MSDEIIEGEVTAIAVRDDGALMHPVALDIVKERFETIQTMMRDVMQDGVDYGKIPGTGNKPTLLQAGAQKISALFQLAPDYEWTAYELDGGHFRYEVKCMLYSGENRVGGGLGSCSSMESKYRYRKGSRLCPACGGDFIIKGKQEYGGGWLCFKKKGGCGAKFKDGDSSIESQSVDRVENPDLEDQRNTVMKMAKKRAYVDAVLAATGASSVFTQDLEDRAEPSRENTSRPPQTKVEAHAEAQAPDDLPFLPPEVKNPHNEDTKNADVIRCLAVKKALGIHFDEEKFRGYINDKHGIALEENFNWWNLDAELAHEARNLLEKKAIKLRVPV